MPPRPGPLQEINMETTYSTSGSPATHKHSSSSSTKRLHSPPTSPAKRQVLTQDRFQKSSRLSRVYAELPIPAKKLDFGFDACMLAQSLSYASLESSPSRELSHIPSARTPTMERPSLSPRSSTRSLQQRYTLVARELPPSCDPATTHYPGFHIHRDSHVPAYENSNGLAESLAAQNSRDREGLKENNVMTARKKIRKSLVATATSSSSNPPAFLTPMDQHKELQKLLPAPTPSWLP